MRCYGYRPSDSDHVARRMSPCRTDTAPRNANRSSQRAPRGPRLATGVRTSGPTSGTTDSRTQSSCHEMLPHAPHLLRNRLAQDDCAGDSKIGEGVPPHGPAHRQAKLAHVERERVHGTTPADSTGGSEGKNLIDHMRRSELRGVQKELLISGDSTRKAEATDLTEQATANDRRLHRHGVDA